MVGLDDKVFSNLNDSMILLALLFLMYHTVFCTVVNPQGFMCKYIQLFISLPFAVGDFCEGVQVSLGTMCWTST